MLYQFVITNKKIRIVKILFLSLSKHKVMKNIFKIDPKTLQPKSINIVGKIIIYTIIVTTIIGSTLFYSGYKVGKHILFNLSEEEKLIIIHEHNKFSEDKLVGKIKELNIKFPHIVFAQAKLETGNFTSKVFRESNNLFGMREAKSRVTTAKGTQFNHAFYDNWVESVYDYAFHQCRYLSNISTEELYFEYLSQSYAEDPNYIKILKEIITNDNLKSRFELSK